MSETQKENANERVEQNNILYSINTKEKIASVICYHSAIEDIIIPRSIIYKSKEYIVKSISKKAFELSQIKSIRFPEDSQLQSIDAYAFSKSSIESLTIPSSLIDLKDGWCEGTWNLTNISVMPRNPKFSCLDEKMIIGKSSENVEIFDELVFCVRNVQTITVPSFIKCIKSYAFEKCKQLKRVDIPNDSQLEIICKNAFSETSIQCFSIPSNLKQIGECAFFKCKQLCKLEISENSQLEIICQNAFSETSIQCFSIPSNIKKIEDGAFSHCNKLQIIEIDSNIKIEEINKNLFKNNKNIKILIKPPPINNRNQLNNTSNKKTKSCYILSDEEFCEEEEEDAESEINCDKDIVSDDEFFEEEEGAEGEEKCYKDIVSDDEFFEEEEGVEGEEYNNDNEDYENYSEDENFEENNNQENNYQENNNQENNNQENNYPLPILNRKQMLELFQKDYTKFLTANFLTQAAKKLIVDFINQPKYSNISIEKKM